MHEDWYIDPEFYAEDCTDLIHEEGASEVFRLMTPCKNCGELRPRDDPTMLATGGICYLCSKSDFHAEKRAMSEGCSRNTETLASIARKITEHDW